MVLSVAGCGGEPGADALDAAPGDVAVEASDVASSDVVSVDVETAETSTDALLDATMTSDGTSSDVTASEAAVDASDAAVDAISLVCGDGIRGLDEECDDQTSNPADLCTSLCEVRDQLAFRAPGDGGSPRQRTLGTGRHPLAIVPGGAAAIAWLEPQVPVRLGATFYSASGVPTGAVDAFAVGSTPSSLSAPVVAALPNGKFVVAWVDLGGDGDGLGIAARVVDPNVASSGAPVRINQTTASSQFDVDVIWTGSDVVFAWTDMSVFPADVRVRTFDAALSPQTAEQTLAGTSATEGTVALASFNGGVASAWREVTSTQEAIRVRVGNATFSTPPAGIAPYDDPPALAPLDPTHLLVVYAEATGSSGSKIRAAVVDVNSPGTLAPFDVGALAQGDAGTAPNTYRPSATAVGASVFVAWTQEAKLADPRADELWLKELPWNGSALDLSRVEVPLPRWDSHRQGDQRLPALAASTLGPAGALGVAWVDIGSTLAGSATTDVALSLFPVPVLRKPNADGGGA